MLQIRSHLDVADNTGAKLAWNIGVIGRNQRYAGIGDVIKVHIKEAAPDGTVKKGEVHDAVVVRTRHIIKRADGSVLRFDRNACVIIDAERIRRARVFLVPWRASCAT
jgi:large subunit ribosomal protein L14